MIASRDLLGISLAWLAVCGVARDSEAATIYQSLDTPTGSWTVTGADNELGDQVTAAGSDRLVTRLSIEIFSQGGIFPSGNPGAATFTARLYSNDGVGGEPSSLLWRSTLVNQWYPGGLSLITFDVPQVLVPDVFTWTIQLEGGPPGMPTTIGTTIGSSDDFTWTRWGGSGVWTKSALPSSWGNNYMARIEAVPEPSTLAMFLLGGIAMISFAICRRQRT